MKEHPSQGFMRHQGPGAHWFPPFLQYILAFRDLQSTFWEKDRRRCSKIQF